MNTTFQILLALALVSSATAAFKCYQCNSEVDKDCNESDLEILKKYNKECPAKSDGGVTGSGQPMCRKILQSVGEEKTTIRECAYNDDIIDGQRKTGNWGISLYYYQCKNENQNTPCNGSSLASFLTAVSVALIAYFH